MVKKYQPQRTHNGKLKTPFVVFYPKEIDTLEVNAILHEVHSGFAEVYNPSMKDLEILNGVNTKQSVTIKFRRNSITFTNKMKVKLLDSRYSEMWNVIDVRFDDEFVTLLLGGGAIE
ncbi:hypothetical protein SAMN02745116_01778 [Pilibacter termitis]|uniref:Phage head-tail adaptor, putative, SPP1 family n=1 Tax=Pilibacter termitis TaxID=263852 RepID=A0A1T4PE57_9ENTE|nr:hypothetical protein [Pilibacter termitis]SJZ89782.1 hypothetical protein SAMN02745116_01778 [Pilibacter termitis]